MRFSRFYAQRSDSRTSIGTLWAPLVSAALVGVIAARCASPLEAGEAFPQARPAAPHPAVVRIIAPGGNSVSYGSGALVAVSQYHGLVVTNWHVIREAVGTIHVLFPGGFRSPATVLRADRDWDLAALAIWRPPVEPIPIAREPPRPGQWLWIAGYGKGSYRVAAGRCTQYYAPGANMPYEIVELSVAAREGDSGGPILNQRGELAGVLFGASWGTTMGSYCGRVERFLAATASQFQRLAPPPMDFAQRDQHNAPSQSAFGTAFSQLAPGSASSEAAFGSQPSSHFNSAGAGWVARRPPHPAERADTSNWPLQRKPSVGEVAANAGPAVAAAAPLGGNAALGHPSVLPLCDDSGPPQPESTGRYYAQIGRNAISPETAQDQLRSADRTAVPTLLGGRGDADGSRLANGSTGSLASDSPTVAGQTVAGQHLGSIATNSSPMEPLKNILALAGALLLAYHALRILGRTIG